MKTKLLAILTLSVLAPAPDPYLIELEGRIGHSAMLYDLFPDSPEFQAYQLGRSAGLAEAAYIYRLKVLKEPPDTAAP